MRSSSRRTEAFGDVTAQVITDQIRPCVPGVADDRDEVG